jgi:hypothetical protein
MQYQNASVLDQGRCAAVAPSRERATAPRCHALPCLNQKYLKNKSDPGPFLATDPPTTGVPGFCFIGGPLLAALRGSGGRPAGWLLAGQKAKAVPCCWLCV